MRGLALVVLVACGGSRPGDTPRDAAPEPATGAAPATWSTTPACTASADAIYASPAVLPGDHGAIVTCALGCASQALPACAR